MKIYTVDLL